MVTDFGTKTCPPTTLRALLGSVFGKLVCKLSGASIVIRRPLRDYLNVNVQLGGIPDDPAVEAVPIRLHNFEGRKSARRNGHVLVGGDSPQPGHIREGLVPFTVCIGVGALPDFPHPQREGIIRSIGAKPIGVPCLRGPLQSNCPWPCHTGRASRRH